MAFDILTVLKDESLFSLKPFSKRSYEKDDETLLDIVIERDLSLQHIKRRSYTIIDIVSDTGGIQSMLFSITTLILSFWNFNMTENYIVSRLFKLARQTQADSTQKRKEYKAPIDVDLMEIKCL